MKRFLYDIDNIQVGSFWSEPLKYSGDLRPVDYCNLVSLVINLTSFLVSAISFWQYQIHQEK